MSSVTVHQYQQVVKAGILTANDKVELLEGLIVERLPRTPLEDSTVDRVFGVLFASRPAGWNIRVRGSVVLSDSQPEPDFAVVRERRDDYMARHPGPADVGLLVEVADSSLLRDLQDKTRIHARAGILVYWVVNLVDRKVEVFSGPDPSANPPAYRTRQAYDPGDPVPLVLDGTAVGSVPAADLLP